jgi:hypothetical protein
MPVSLYDSQGGVSIHKGKNGPNVEVSLLAAARERTSKRMRVT